jgi:hypothetical protein
MFISGKFHALPWSMLFFDHGIHRDTEKTTGGRDGGVFAFSNVSVSLLGTGTSVTPLLLRASVSPWFKFLVAANG